MTWLLDRYSGKIRYQKEPIKKTGFMLYEHLRPLEFDTWREAHAGLVKRLEDEIVGLEKKTQNARKRLARALQMSDPASEV